MRRPPIHPPEHLPLRWGRAASRLMMTDPRLLPPASVLSLRRLRPRNGD